MIATANMGELASDRRAVTAVEYGLIAALVVAVGLSAMNIIGLTLDGDFGRVLGTFG